jgi:hypothetical protein
VSFFQAGSKKGDAGKMVPPALEKVRDLGFSLLVVRNHHALEGWQFRRGYERIK